MSIALVNQVQDVSFANKIPTMTLSVTKGNLLVFWSESQNNNTIVVSDGINTWIPVTYAQAGGYGKGALQYAIAQTTASITIQIFETVPTNGTTGVIGGTAPANMAVFEGQLLQFSGASQNPFETFHFATGTSTAPASAVTVTGAADLILGIAGPAGGSTVKETAGWTNSVSPNTSYASIYAVETGSGTFTPTFLQSLSGAWGCIAAAFKAAGTQYTISGALGAIGSGATVFFLSQTTNVLYSCTADGSGNYTSPGLENDSFYVWAQKVGVTYGTYPYPTVTINGGNVTQNLTGTSVPTTLTLTTTFSDSFNRANESPLANGNWSVDGTPIPPEDAGCAIVSHQCVMSDATVYANYGGPWSGTGDSILTGPSLTNDQFAQFTVATLNASAFHYANAMLSIRTDSGNATGYYASIHNNGDGTCNFCLTEIGTSGAPPIQINSWFYGTFPFGQLVVKNLAFSLGDTFAVAALGTTVYLLHNGTIVANYTDNIITSGKAAIVLFGTSTSDVAVTNFLAGSVTQGSVVGAYEISGNAGVAGATITYSGAASGTVTSDTTGTYTIPNLSAGAYTITPSLTGYTFTPSSASKTIVASNINGVNFTAKLAASPWSQVDSRNFGKFPNSTVDVQNTQTYTVPAAPSHAPPVDSRVTKPKDCRKNPNIPLNSRKTQV